MVVQPSLAEDQPTTFPILMPWAEAELAAMCRDGVLRAAELARMTILQYERHPSDVRAPFAAGRFAGLRIKHDAVDAFSDPFWEAYLADRDGEALAGHYVRFFQAPFQPALLAALDGDRDDAFRRAFARRLESGLRRRILSEPRCLLTPLAVHTVLLEKS